MLNNAEPITMFYDDFGWRLCHKVGILQLPFDANGFLVSLIPFLPDSIKGFLQVYVTLHHDTYGQIAYDQPEHPIRPLVSRAYLQDSTAELLDVWL